MSDERGPNHGRRLLRLACEAIVESIRGCSDLVRVAAAHPGALAALDRFGPFIASRWAAWLANLSPQAREEAMQQLAGIDSRAASVAVSALMRTIAPDASDEDRRVAADYLSAIPATVRAALVPDLDSGRAVLPTRPDPLGADLLRLLPLNVPPFSVGSDLPGTPYRLEQLLGSGGFGVVYKASNRFEQNSPPRAIKFCLNAEMAATLHREKVLLDRLLAAGSRGPWPDRIVQLYGHHLDAEIPFLIYEYVPGGCLLTRLAAGLRAQSGQPLRPAQVLGLIRRVCEAVGQAHTFGVVHRDLKPANFLVSGNTIKLADFGIGGVMARVAQAGQASGAALSVSQRCSVFRGAGTPLYMAPEQRQGLPPEPNHDVYSIGVIWYQFLVGDASRELHTGWADELIEEHDVPQRHVELIRSCVGYAKKRPATAKDLLAQLPSPTAPAAPPMKAAAAGLSGTLRGHKGKVNAVAFLRDPRRVLSGGADGTARLWDGDAGRAVAEFSPGPSAVLAAAVSPDERWALLGCDNGFAFLWGMGRGGEPRCLAGHTFAVSSVAFAPDGRRAVTGGHDGTVRVWHVGTGRELTRMEEADRRPVSGVCFTPDSLSVVSCAEGGGLRLWDAETGWETRELAAGGWMLCVAVSPDGRLLACGGKEGLALWDLETGLRLEALAGHNMAVTGVAFTQSGRHLLSGGLDRAVRLWDVAARKAAHVFQERQHLVRGVAVSADGRSAASCGDDEMVRLWTLPTA